MALPIMLLCLGLLASVHGHSIVRAMFDNYPVTDVTSAPIACNGKNDPAPLVADVKAGATVKYQWTTWPALHKGPIVSLSIGDAFYAQLISFFRPTTYEVPDLMIMDKPLTTPLVQLASCNGDCKTFKATDGKWFKVDQAGFDNTTQKWATEVLVAKCACWPTTYRI